MILNESDKLKIESVGLSQPVKIDSFHTGLTEFSLLGRRQLVCCSGRECYSSVATMRRCDHSYLQLIG